ncbi:hypothetical protein [Candidatus Nitrosocosmicus sp. T]
MNNDNDKIEQSEFNNLNNNNNNSNNLIILSEKDPLKKNKNLRSGLTAKKYKKQIEWRRDKIKELYIRNYSQGRISTKLRISQPTLCRDINNLKNIINKRKENFGQYMIEENLKLMLVVDEQIRKDWNLLDDPKLEPKELLKAQDTLMKLMNKKEQLNTREIITTRLSLIYAEMIEKEKEIKEKEMILEAFRQNTKLSWGRLKAATSNEAIF